MLDGIIFSFYKTLQYSCTMYILNIKNEDASLFYEYERQMGRVEIAYSFVRCAACMTRRYDTSVHI